MPAQSREYDPLPHHPHPHPRSPCREKSSPSPRVKPWLLPQTLLEQIITLPQQLLFVLLGMLGLASYARQIVRVNAAKPATITLKDKSKEDVAAWINRNTPSLGGTFKPAWWAPNGHMQTAFTVTGDFSDTDHVDYARTLLRVPDGGTIALDMTPPSHASLPPDAPTIVVCHGLTGNAREAYVRNVLHWAALPASHGGLGARGVVVNFRGCGGTPLTSAQLYSAATTCDLTTATHYLRARFPQSALFGVGFSLGASVMARYLGERGESSLLSAGVVLAAPWDVVALSHALEDGWFSSRVYSKALGENLIRMFFRNYDAYPEIAWSETQRQAAADLKQLQEKGPVRLKTVDEVLTRKVGGPQPPFPFSSADEYYAYAGSHQLIENVAVPTLGINAFDDPVVHGSALPFTQVQKGSHVQLAVTGGGGHLGWFDGPFWSKTRWVRIPIAEFLAAGARDLAPRAEVIVESDEGIDEKEGVMETDIEYQEAVKEKGESRWEWCKGPLVVPQTGARPTRIGWRVVAEGLEVPDLKAPTVQGL